MTTVRDSHPGMYIPVVSTAPQRLTENRKVLLPGAFLSEFSIYEGVGWLPLHVRRERPKPSAAEAELFHVVSLRRRIGTNPEPHWHSIEISV